MLTITYGAPSTGSPAQVMEAIQLIINRGHTVQIMPDVPGLYRINNGPELTTNQLLSEAAKY